MKNLFAILNKSITAEYYRQNMIFIFVVILFCFGFLRAIEHITIIKLILKLPALLLLTFLVWAVYGAKTILFALRLLESGSYEFLYHARLFPWHKRILAFSGLMFNLLLLTFIYSVFMIKIGIDEQKFVSVGMIILFHILLILTGALILEYRIRRPNPEKIIANSFQGIFSKFRTPPTLFFIRHLASKQPVLLLITKVFSGLMLMGFCFLYPTDDYDERLLSIAGLLTGASHIVFNQHFIRFEHLNLSFARNLPIPFVKRLSGYFKTYGLLLIPEMIILIRNLPDEVSYLFGFQLLVFMISVILFNHHLHYINGISQDTIIQRLFFGGIALFLLIMFKVPLLILSAVLLTGGILVFRKHYYRSEYQEE